MSDDAGIADSLPPPRSDEPADLRRDITDELNDHLSCATRREMLRGEDEPDARRIAGERFGNLKAVARRLWWDAMKEQIMIGRLSLAVSIIALCSVGVFIVFAWLLLQDQRAMNQMLLVKLQELPAHDAAATPPAKNMEWGSLTINLFDENSKPMQDWPIVVKGNMYRSGMLERTFKTDDQGKVIIDPISAGSGYSIDLQGVNGWDYYIHASELILEPGEHKTHTIRHPPKSQDAQIIFDFDTQEIADDQTLDLTFNFTRQRAGLSEHEYWNCVGWTMAVKSGSVTTLHRHDQDTPINILPGDPVTLPEGVYQLVKANATSESWTQGVNSTGRGRGVYSQGPQITSSQYRKIEENTFKVTPADVNRITLPLPQRVSKQIEVMTKAYPSAPPSEPDAQAVEPQTVR